MNARRPTPAGPELVLIAAMARNRVIGKDNRLLWHLPEDLKHFKELTTGRPVIMGRKTWESLPEKFRPLPGRRNLVISRKRDYAAPGAELAGSLAAALAKVAEAAEVFVIGGAQVYAEALPLADRVELTVLATDYDGDARFPELDAGWAESARSERQGTNGLPFAFVTYRRALPSAEGSATQSTE